MRVVLIGDSIRMGYQPRVIEKLAGDCDVWGPAVNCRHSSWALDHFDEWVTPQVPDVVHVNFGIHDASIQADGQHQILLEQYRLCLQRFIGRVKGMNRARMIWATTTPLYQPDANVSMDQWSPHAAAEVDAYNVAARQIVDADGLAVNDLHDAIMRHGFSKCLSEDGCHMTDFGNEILSDAVVTAIRTSA